MAKQSKKSKDEVKESIIKPLIKMEGETHLFEELEAADELPVIKSIGYCRVAPNSRDYVSYTIVSRGREVLSIEVSEPNARLIAVDDAKLAFMTVFEDSDEAFQQDVRHAESKAAEQGSSDDE